jgi:hypothetical protein
MTNHNVMPSNPHSAAWIAQSWLTFGLSLTATLMGIFALPVDGWIKGYLGIGFVFTVSSTVSVSKTTRDIHEAKRITARVDEAHVERLLAEHHPLKYGDPK